MGVPAFFRWLSRKYPSIVISCIEEKVINGLKIPVDATQPNPNEVEFDNLYLDMNGIIHPCCHPEDKPAPKDEDEMMAAIFEYIDRIFNIIRPRRLLYMAIDGVAPRAKMNQQRSRRFRAAKESVEKREEIKHIRSELESRGCELPPEKPDHAHFDSNCITPGTEFMARLAECLQYYIHDRMNSNPAWQGIKVILSDANVPGEGEHKIMDYIRRQRSQPDHDPNTHHCLYGADADLIMLGLSTHEPNFTILREEFKPNQPRPCEICGQYGHSMKECMGAAREKMGEFDEMANSNVSAEKEFIFLRLCILREYLERELRIDGLPFPFDLEECLFHLLAPFLLPAVCEVGVAKHWRAIDDWVFMCFFVGNDFLPHLPSLQIREGAIDRLIRLYKDIVPQTEGYLTHNGKVNLPRVQLMLTELGKVEDEIFKKRRRDDLDFRRRQRSKKKQRRMSQPSRPLWTPQGQFAPTPVNRMPSPVQNARHEAYQMRQESTLVSNQAAATDFKQWLRRSGSEPSTPSALTTSTTGTPPSAAGNGPPEEERLARKRKLEDSGVPQNEDSDSEPEDNVRLWEDGWKERYYLNKFGVPCDDDEFVSKVAEAYTQGLCWVLGYYYQGCPSWKWFFPFHYAPFASDFKNIGGLRNDFDRGTEPFNPLEQLMGVFPAASGSFLPESWRELMMREDSPIIDLYPTNFKIDLNGKKYAWQGVALLPFVEEDRLLQALSQVYPDLTKEEAERNARGSDRLFVYRHNRLYPFLKTLYETYGRDHKSEPVQLNSQHTQGMRGIVCVDERMRSVLEAGGTVKSTLPELPDIKNSFVMCAKFQDPQQGPDYIFEAVLLPGAKLAERVLRPPTWSNSTSGSYRPKTGFATPPSRMHPYHNPEPAQRMIRHSLSDPRGQRYPTPPPFDQYNYQPPYQPQFPRRPPPSVASWSPLPAHPHNPPSHYNPPYQPQPPSRSYTSPSQFGHYAPRPPHPQNYRGGFRPPRRPPGPSPRRSGYY